MIIYSDEKLKSYCNKNNVFIFKKLNKKAIYPAMSTQFAVGLDLYAYYDIIIPAGKCVLVDLGLGVFIPDDCELQIRPRSGLSLKGVLAIFGTIDPDYSGMALGIILFNSCNNDFQVMSGIRIAQAVRSYVCNYKVLDSNLATINYSDFQRTGGFGSTGI